MKGMLDALMNKFISPISKGLVELINIFFVEAKSDEHGLEIPSDTYAPNKSIFKGKYILCSSYFLQFFPPEVGVGFLDSQHSYVASYGGDDNGPGSFNLSYGGYDNGIGIHSTTN
jgi:hypothetical protein